MQTLTKNSNSAVIKLTNNFSEIMQDLLARAKKKGATDAAVSLTQSSGFSIDVRMGEVETVAFNEDKSLSLVVYVGHRKGAASSTDLSATALDALVTAAYDIAKASAADPCFGLAPRELLTKAHPDLELYHPWEIKPPEAIQKALACEKYALALDERIVNSDGVNLSTYAFGNGYANTHGCEAIVPTTRHSISSSFIAKEGESMQRDFAYTIARDFKELISLEDLAKNAVARTTGRLRARKIKTQKTPVLFSSRVSNTLFSSFVNAIKGTNLYRKNSFLIDALGKPIFPRGIEIYEQPHLLKGLGSSPIDGDGVPTRNNVFVKDGILQQFALGSYSARRLGLQSTANSDGVHNLTVAPTAGEFSDLLHKLGKGLLVTELMGSGVNGLTGNYSRGASGFWVENGVIQYPVVEVTIAGNLKDMFRAICAIGTDINPNIATRCGSVLIEQMMVAGH